MIDLSIVIPFYNGKEYIDLLLSQLVDIDASKEIIIIDDGSNIDNSTCCKELCLKYKDLKVFQKHNEGIVATRNKGLELACGKYVLFVDQDDEIDPQIVSRALIEVRHNDLDGAIWSTAHLYHEGRFSPCDTVMENRIIERNEIENDLIPSMLLMKSGNYVTYLGHVWAFLFKKEVLLENGIEFKSYHSFEDDFVFVYDFLLSAKNLILVPSIGYYWRENELSTSHTAKYIKDYLQNAERFQMYLYNRFLFAFPYKDDEAKRFLLHARQRIMVRAIKNESIITDNRKAGYKYLKEKFKSEEYRVAFQLKPLATMKLRIDKILLKLLSRRFFCFSFLLSKAYMTQFHG